jgi:hypothetical protein
MTTWIQSRTKPNLFLATPRDTNRVCLSNLYLGTQTGLVFQQMKEESQYSKRNVLKKVGRTDKVHNDDYNPNNLFEI